MPYTTTTYGGTVEHTHYLTAIDLRAIAISSGLLRMDGFRGSGIRKPPEKPVVKSACAALRKKRILICTCGCGRKWKSVREAAKAMETSRWRMMGRGLGKGESVAVRGGHIVRFSFEETA